MAKTRTRRGYFIPLVLVITFVVAAVDVFPVRQLIAQNRELEESTVRLKEIQEENARLEREIEALHAPAAIERIARADFGYVRPGETSYVVIDPDEELFEVKPEEGQPEPEGAPDSESGGFWEALWDYLTGRDLTDG